MSYDRSALQGTKRQRHKPTASHKREVHTGPQAWSQRTWALSSSSVRWCFARVAWLLQLWSRDHLSRSDYEDGAVTQGARKPRTVVHKGLHRPLCTPVPPGAQDCGAPCSGCGTSWESRREREDNGQGAQRAAPGRSVSPPRATSRTAAQGPTRTLPTCNQLSTSEK